MGGNSVGFKDDVWLQNQYHFFHIEQKQNKLDSLRREYDVSTEEQEKIIENNDNVFATT